MRTVIDKNKLLGLVMGLAAALIGGSWQVATRHATTTSMAPEDLVILRYGIPSLLLLPVALRLGFFPPQIKRLHLLALVMGAGLPFGLAAMTGSRFAPASHMGVLMAGASPLIAALLAWLIWGDRLDATRRLGLALMLIGVLLLGAKSVLDWSQDTWRGDLLFLMAATLWAGYSLTFKRSGLSPWHAAALVNLWSMVMVIAWVGVRGGTQIWQAPMAVIAWQALWQGLLAGVLGLWTFSVAIKHLGAAPAAAFGALAPVVSAVGGWYILGDPLSTLDYLAVAAAVLGVLAVNGLFTKSRPSSPGNQATERET